MNFTLKLTFILSLAAVALTAPTKSTLPDLTNRFIIKLRASSSPAKIRSLIAISNQSVGRISSSIKYEYTIINGVAGTFDPELINQLRQDHDVEAVIPDGIATIMGDTTQTSPPSWGLSRVSERKLDLTQPYIYPSAGGAGVDVYVVDTGIVDTHTEFGGRAKMLQSFVDGEAATDLNGHGTHCSGTIGSKSYGVAKSVHIYGIKVLNSAGSGTWAGVVAGINAVGTTFVKGTSPPRVLSMSLGGSTNQAVNDAVTALANKGVVVVSAAGNSYGADACTFSPAGAPGGLAVGATDKTDTMAVYSNAGTCVGVLAPGTDITSLWMGADGATNTISGTSMATPHVAGVAALYLASNPSAAPKDVFDAITNASTKSVIQGMRPNTVNRLLFNFRSE